jgi:hypothetical protein
MKTASFTRPLTVSFSQEVFQKIKAITDQRGISMAEWVRIAAEHALTETNKENGGNK